VKKEKFRRKYIVNKKYQFSQVAVALAANLLVALLMAMLLSWFYLFVQDGGVAVNHNQQAPVYLAGAILLIVFVSMFWSLRRSRVISGMIEKLDSVLTDAGNGIFPDSPLIFRKGDHFTSLAVPLNKCIAQLQERADNRTATVSVLQTLVNRIDTEGMSSSEVVNSLTDIIIQQKKFLVKQE